MTYFRNDYHLYYEYIYIFIMHKLLLLQPFLVRNMQEKIGRLEHRYISL